MNVICLDGTEIECESFRAIDSGVLLFDEEQNDEEEGDAVGFVPHEELRYVLPDGALEGPPAGERAPQQEPDTPVPQGGTGQWTSGRAPQQSGQRQAQGASPPPEPPGRPRPPAGPDRER